ncbi:hypothetical protein F0562_008343 [Nyssa sinensis]|uniref:U2A'/phosphoprotein 32 family A C-terminal domain-containing protein n=1 Tax=Nyssa sinensis TaxID=561372 RepID=A0A5J5A895_9ASTE|nr:hypothetical protein F0562_008343 [Nyssa sinensis]
MVRFSCFHAQVNSPKPKKTVQLSVEAMQKELQDCSQNHALKDFTNSSGLNPKYLKVQSDAFLDNINNNVTSSSSVDCGWKLEDINSKYNVESDIRVSETSIKKSRSLGSGLDQEGRFSGPNDWEDETVQEFFCDGSHDHDGLVPVNGKNPEISLPGQYQEALPSDSHPVSSDLVNNESIFLIGDPQHSEKDHKNSDSHFSGECAGESSHPLTCTPPVIVRSSSLPNISSFGGRSAPAYLAPRSRSSEDLHIVYIRQKEMSVHVVGTQVIQDHERDDSVSNNEKNIYENRADDSYDSYNYVGSAKDWIIPAMDEVNTVKTLQGKSSAHQWKELSSKDFKIKRIEEWVIDLQHCSPLEETNELSDSNDHQVHRGNSVSDNLTAAKLDGKVTPGMEAAKKYISSLSATATTAQLANHGLVVIPFLSAFVSLRALNLSGNTIGRITAGALPRGLHILNLSKNKISAIEGLRELTRLRVLDLSYNRIVRIGHGLASCSSLKELYLAGNKISEVDGLHRLLKLNVLDLRFNKISTAKCLGQLAANYNSLQAISLEGNPAQKNVGDEQLKKYLQGLLPHMAYFNRQSIKVGTFKDAADRSARLGFTAHQLDHGLRSEHKTLRKESHGVAANKTSSSSIHGRKSQPVVSPKRSRGGHGRLPPSGTKTTTNQRHRFYNFSSKILSFKSDLFIRRSRSEGTLAAL